MQHNIQIAESVFQRIKSLREKSSNQSLNLRIAVSGGGCSGFIYNYSMDDKTKEDDMIIDSGGVKVLIDPVSVNFLENSIVEYIEELGSAYFSIRNPNASAKCGCGNSFAI